MIDAENILIKGTFATKNLTKFQLVLWLLAEVIYRWTKTFVPTRQLGPKICKKKKKKNRVQV